MNKAIRRTLFKKKNKEMGSKSRLLWLLVLTLALVAACTNEQTPPATPGEDAYFSANLQRTGVYDAAGVVDDPAVAWQFQTGEWVFTAPAIVGDSVYFGSYDGHLYAVDTQTGEEQWRFQTGEIVISSPTVVDGRLYFGGMDGNVYALDTQGKELWRREMGGGVSASPAVSDGLVVI